MDDPFTPRYRVRHEWVHFDVFQPVLLKFQILYNRGLVDHEMRRRSHIDPEPARIPVRFEHGFGTYGPADRIAPLEYTHAVTGTRKITRRRHAVVARSDHYHIIMVFHTALSFIYCSSND